jgi:hypothetical protein
MHPPSFVRYARMTLTERLTIPPSRVSGIGVVPTVGLALPGADS